MSKYIVYKVCISLLYIFCITSCGSSDDQNFDYELRGMWVSNDPSSTYLGSLHIEYDKITIDGYGESQTPILGDDNQRPFKGSTKGTPLKAYSEDGMIYIKDVGAWQKGIPYIFYTGYSNRDKFMRINFNGREEILQFTK